MTDPTFRNINMFSVLTIKNGDYNPTRNFLINIKGATKL